MGRRLAAIVAAYVAGYSRLMGLDEVGTARTLREHRKVTDAIVEKFGGRLVNTPDCAPRMPGERPNELYCPSDSLEGAMDDDEGDRSRIEKAIEAVKDMTSSITDAAKSAATPSEEAKMTVMDVPLAAEAAAMPLPLVAPRQRKARVKRAPMKTPPKKAAAEKAAKKAAKKSAKKSAAKKSKKANHSPATAERKIVRKKKVAKKKKATKSRR
jgi:hypothetical protein